MKVTYASDLHLEFGALGQEIEGGDVLVFAGDITLAGLFDKECNLYHQLPHLRKRTTEFIDGAVGKFERVFYLIGNHEAYHYNLTATPKILRKVFKDVEILDDRAVDLASGVILVGGTLWTSMNNGKAHDYVGGGISARMNDFNVVNITSKGESRKFTTYDAAAKFAKTKRLIEKTARDNPSKTIVVATHHAPSRKGLNPFHGGNELDAGYCSDLEDFIKGLSNIRYWIHGHTHIQKKYRIGQCDVMSNARGYVGREACARSFDFNRSFDVIHAGKEKGPEHLAMPGPDAASKQQ